MSERHDDNSVNGILDELLDAAGSGGAVTVGRMAEAVGHRGYGPFLTIPALIEISPIGGIPGLPTLLALIIVIFSAQIAWGRDHLWLPDALEKRSVKEERLTHAVDRIRPVANWLDKWFHRRLERFAGPSARRAAAVVAILLCLTVPPLELVPFASTAPMGAIALIGLAMLVRDGALMLAAFALAAVGAAVALGALGSGSVA